MNVKFHLKLARWGHIGKWRSYVRKNLKASLIQNGRKFRFNLNVELEQSQKWRSFKEAVGINSKLDLR